MKKVSIGNTGLSVNKNGFGALPIQRISMKDAVGLLHKAYDNGVDFYDTARFYTDSEEKLGEAFSDRRSKIVIASKTGASTVEEFWKDLHTTLTNLKTDYLDIYQFHNPPYCPKPGDKAGLYDAMKVAQRQGKVRFIGISNHRQSVALDAIEQGGYDTLQYPFSYLSSDEDLTIVEAARGHGMGFICMKALSGGLITDSALAYAFLDQYDYVLPIWGIQRESELDEFISYQTNPPVLNAEMWQKIEADRKSLSGDFCRGCGYCMPCTVGIQINDCNRMSLFLRRAPLSVYLTEEWAEKMKLIENCVHCDQCKSRCPYNLDIPDLLRRNYEDFQTFWNNKK
ncbi:MAG: aldo/keto reductase [Bacteroidales bacterium]|nr:aldo/keto reductase [Bacteroidales bacterium]